MKLFYFLVLLNLFSCRNVKNQEKNKNGSSLYEEKLGANDNDNIDDAEYDDGTWCAEVEYYNPNTGTRNTYSLDVEVEDGELVQIHWPNGGWLDESHFVAEDISEGECSFTSDKGYQYTVTLDEEGGCSSNDAFRLRNDMEEERKSLPVRDVATRKKRMMIYVMTAKIKQKLVPNVMAIRWSGSGFVVAARTR